MAHPVHHPLPEQITLSAVLAALSDPVRLRIVVRLAEAGEGRCSSFLDLGSKANLTYHLARLREAGVISVRLEGPYRYASLRKHDLEALFPGLLPAVLAGTRRGATAERATREARRITVPARRAARRR
jgi:DNA-binding transcriptional ArsR family regulator